MAFDPARAMFNQADVNSDGTIDRREFNNWASGANVSGATLTGASAYDAAVLNGGAYGAGLVGGVYGTGLVGGGLGYSDVSGYESSAVYGSGAYGSGAYGSGAYGSGAYGYGAGLGLGLVGGGAQVVDSSFATTAVGQTYAADAQGNYIDSNPTIIRRPNAAGVQTYTQNVAVRFLQPPPVPPHGPLIIREVRPPQPPPPPPLRLRQQAPPLPQPPPLVLREHPPPPPRVIPSQTVIRRLPGLPVPPRSVIIERLPPLPPRPRDVVIERWVPYGLQAKRRTIVQRAAAPRPYAAPRNVIIQYEPAQVRVVRQFQRLGVTAANPVAYVQTYGAQLLDAASLVNSARAAGVVEDISPPAIGYNAAAYGQNVVVGGAGWAGDVGLVGDAGWAGSAGWTTGGAGWSDASLGGGAGWAGGAGWSDASLVGGAGWNTTGLVGDAGWAGTVVGGGAYGLDAVDAAFDNADVNRDGRIDRNEFNRFVEQGL